MNASKQPLLRAERVSFAYDNGRVIFNDVSLQIQRREIVVLLGGSGCGKSTLLRLLAGLDSAHRGQVYFMNEPVNRPYPRSALVFQQASLLPWLPVADNVAYGLNFKHQPKISATERKQRVQEALDAVGLAHHDRTWPAQLSGGSAQRVALARALARKPELLFADEPFSSLDAISRVEMQRLLVQSVHRWNTAVLLVTHDIDEALMVADRIILMGGSPGRIYREWQCDQAHPRNQRDSATAAMRDEILCDLHNLHQVNATAKPAATPSSSASPLRYWSPTSSSCSL